MFSALFKHGFRDSIALADAEEVSNTVDKPDGHTENKNTSYKCMPNNQGPKKSWQNFLVHSHRANYNSLTNFTWCSECVA